MSLKDCKVSREIKLKIDKDWTLCLQECQYIYGNGSLDNGYRFIWQYKNDYKRYPDQTRIPKLEDSKLLIELAQNEKWGTEVIYP